MTRARSQKMKERWADPNSNFRARMTADFKDRAADPEFQRARLNGLKKKIASDAGYRERRDERIRNMNADLEVQIKRIAAIQRASKDPILREHRSEKQKARWNQPGARKRWSASMKKVQGRPEVRARKSFSARKRWSDPEYNRRVSAAIKAAASSPEARERRSKTSKATWASRTVRKKRIAGIKAAHARPEVRARKSEISKKTWADPKVRLRRMAPARKRKIARLQNELEQARAADILRSRNLGGRPKGIGRITASRLRHLAAAKRLDRRTHDICALVYPDFPKSAERNANQLLSAHRAEIESLASLLSPAEARKILSAPVTMHS